MGATHSHVCRAHSLFKRTNWIQPRMHRLEISLNQEARSSEIHIGAGVRRDLGNLIPFKAPRRVGIISNQRVFDLYGREVMRSLKSAGFKSFVWLMPEGERYKSFRILEKAV